MRFRTLLYGLLMVCLFAAPAVAQAGALRADEEQVPKGPRLKTLKTDLQKAILAQNKQRIEEALFQYRVVGGRKAIRSLMAILPKIPTNMNTAYWQVINGIAAFEDEEGLVELAAKIIENKSKGLSRDLMYGLRNNRDSRVIHAHTVILAKGNAALQQMSIDQLTDIRVIESVDAIIAAWKDGSLKKSIAWWADRSLQILTGANLGNDPERWHEWWQYQREKGLPKSKDDDDYSGMATDNLDPIRKYEFKILKKMPKGRVVVLHNDCEKCDFDTIQNILGRMNIPHTVVTRKEFEKPSYTLKGVMALVVNCTRVKPLCHCPTCVPGGTRTDRAYRCTQCDKHDSYNHLMNSKGIKKIKRFVEKGGNLFTEDWGVKEIIEINWPKFLVSGSYLKEQQVDIAPARGRTSHPLMRGVFADPADRLADGDDNDDNGDGGKPDPEDQRTKDGKKTLTPQDEEEIIRRIRTLNHEWKVDDESPYLKIKNPREVAKLLESEKIGKLANGHDGVAVTFFPRRVGAGSGAASDGVERRPSGRVLHVLSHFGKQASLEDEYALQNLLLNFLLEANRYWYKAKQAKEKAKK
ncbi:MAG: hypothetical protein O7H41_20500 [Planctomycetota bacterium]|nr:hypothetical protein [Planctomycetota bacterium]